MRPVALTLAVLASPWLLVGHAPAQQATVSTPFRSLNDSFYEHMGTNWSLQGRGWNFSFGAPNNAAPQFGGFQPNAGANLGFSILGPGVSGNFNANWSQGYRQSLVSQTPSVTLPNGGVGWVSDSSVSPFVMGYIPVVGGFPVFGSVMPPAPPPYSVLPQGAAVGGGSAAVQEALRRARAKADAPSSIASSEGRLPDARVDEVLPPAQNPGAAAKAQASSAARAAPSVKEARQLHAAEQTTHDADAMRYLEMGRSAEESGKANVARIYYQMAARRASGPLKDQILSRIKALEAGPKDQP